ncbi:MAG: HAD-IA family hydrolase [Acidobacteriota bacterium]
MDVALGRSMLIVFDLDGTLVDTLEDLAVAASLLAVEYGGRPLEPARVARMVGEGASVLVERVLATAGLGEPPAGALARFTEIYERVMYDHTAAYPGVPELLRSLSATHVLGLLTNKPARAATATLEHCNVATHFEHRVFGDGGLPRKPDPAGLRWLMQQHQASAGHTLMVGDSLVDVETARRGGVRICLARYGFGFDGIPAGALRGDEAWIDQPLELLALVSPGAAACPPERRGG